MPEIHEILTALLKDGQRHPHWTPLSTPFQTAIKTAADQIQQQQRERVKKLLKEFHEFTVEVRQKGVVPEARLEGLEISVHQFQAALAELETPDA